MLAIKNGDDTFQVEDVHQAKVDFETYTINGVQLTAKDFAAGAMQIIKLKEPPKSNGVSIFSGSKWGHTAARILVSRIQGEKRSELEKTFDREAGGMIYKGKQDMSFYHTRFVSWLYGYDKELYLKHWDISLDIAKKDHKKTYLDPHRDEQNKRRAEKRKAAAAKKASKIVEKEHEDDNKSIIL